MTLLLLGGTADAQQLARELTARGAEVIYSIAGLVRRPELECRVISGGFSAQGGLGRFVENQAIDAIVDATHPYAERMSETARQVTRQAGLPLWRYQRPPWQAGAGDDWREFGDWSELPGLLSDRHSVFFTAGQPTQAFVEQWQNNSTYKQQLVLRTATLPDIELPVSMEWLEAIGPFDIDAERALFARYAFDALVSKNSGGEATVAKLEVARDNQVPVFLLRRPSLSPADVEFDTVVACADYVAAQHGEVA